MTTTTRPTVMELLKASTQDLHDAAENHEFQRDMFKGKISREAYAAYLGQMLLVHRTLEGRLTDVRSEVPVIGRIVASHQYQAPYLLEDLAFLDVDPDSISPTPATKAIIERIGRASPLALLGMHYVLEGSNNGSRYIAVNIRKAFDLQPGRGDRYLDPYGEDQRQHWAAFKRDMDAEVFTDEQQETLVAAAREMFEAISHISEDLAAL
ncbi:MAG: biliverdin-producing heme oxygenase [Phycisphaeraceae bacterium]|nr:MAG: biliverdin-producing heme oxygenase [Phycisphaeraceae bacterium]